MNVFHGLAETYRNDEKIKAFIITMHKIHSKKVIHDMETLPQIEKFQSKVNIGTPTAISDMFN